MKLINQSFNSKNIDCDEILGHVYKNERMYQGSRCHMRLRYNRGKAPMMEWWDERPGGAGHGTWATIQNRIGGHIEKYVGRKFDDCFSDFIRKCKYNKDYKISACGFGSLRNSKVTRESWAAEFLDYFKYGLWGASYIVEDGIIKHDPTKVRRHRNRDVILYSGELYYRFKPSIYRVLPFIKRCKNNPSTHEWVTGKISEETYRRIHAEFSALAYAIYIDKKETMDKYGDVLPDLIVNFCKSNRWNAATDIMNQLFERVDERERTVIKYHTKQWYQYTGTKKRKHVDLGPYYDRSLWVSNYIKSHPATGVSFHQLMEYTVKDAMIQNFISYHGETLKGRWGVDTTIQNELIEKLEELKNNKTIPNY